jgi:phage replication initiation protein
VPPSSNTGAQITAPSENRSIIDWFAFTLKKNDVYEVVDLMGFKRGLFSELERGGMGYKKRLQYGHITIYFDGSADMGIHVEMSGQGCREYETSKHTWSDLIALIELEKGKITRLDIAIDTVDKSLDFSLITKCLKLGNVRSRFTKSRLMISSDITPEGLANESQTRYFGSGSSRVQFRIYDKAAQLGLETDWIRFELQLREDRATAAAFEILRRSDLGFVAAGIINQYLAFINNDDSNRSRCSLTDWWFNWLHHTEKLKLTTAKVMKTITQVKDFIKKQYAPTLAMIKKSGPYHLFQDFIKEVLDDGYTRMSQKHDRILENSKLCALNLCSDLPF